MKANVDEKIAEFIWSLFAKCDGKQREKVGFSLSEVAVNIMAYIQFWAIRCSQNSVSMNSSALC